MKKIAIVTVGLFPVPATQGGAVETLVTSLIKQNEIDKKAEFSVYSIFDKVAQEESKKLLQSKIYFIKTPSVIKKADRLIFKIMSAIFPKKDCNQMRYMLQRLHFLIKCKQHILVQKYDNVVFENHPTILMLLKNSHFYKKYKGKIIYHAHNEIDNVYGFSKELKRVDRFFTVSEAISRSICDKWDILPQKCVVLKNCIDTKRFNIEKNEQILVDIRSKYNISEGEKVIVFAGRLVEEKGADILISVFNELNLQNTKLLIMGGISYTLDFRSEYKHKLIELSSNNKNIIFTGYIPYFDIQNYYKMAYLAVFPSVWFEPAGMTILEAMACGLPVITTRMGGIPEYTQNAAILIEKDEKLKENLKNAILNILINPDEANKMGRKSALIASKYSERNYYLQFNKFLFKEEV